MKISRDRGAGIGQSAYFVPLEKNQNLEDELKKILTHYRNISLNFTKNDELVHLDGSAQIPLGETCLMPLQQVQTLLKQTVMHEKESGSNVLCAAYGLLTWKYKEETVTTPVMLQSMDFTVQKIKQQVEFEPQGEPFLNPFLQYVLHEEFDIVLPELNNLSEALVKLRGLGFTTIDESAAFIGNFHHHRFAIVQDLDSLLLSEPSSNINRLFGTETSEKEFSISWPARNLLPCDSDQMVGLDQMSKANCVVQGPPGTGKSQFLTNAIGRCLSASLSTLVLSDKRTALSVIENRLRTIGLGSICHVATDKKDVRGLLQELKKQWLNLEQFSSQESYRYSSLSSQVATLQSTLNALHHPSLIGGLSFVEFQGLVDQSRAEDEFSQLPLTYPLLSEWRREAEKLNRIYGAGHIALLVGLKTKYYQTADLNELQGDLEEIKQTLHQYPEMGEWILNDFRGLIKEVAIMQIFDTSLYRQHGQFLDPRKSKQGRLLKLYHQWIQAQQNIDHIAWIKEPDSLTMNRLEAWWNKGLWSNRRAKRLWSQFSLLPWKDFPLVNEQFKAIQDQRQEITSVELKIRKLGYQGDWEGLKELIASIPAYSENKWRVYEELVARGGEKLLKYNWTITSRLGFLLDKWFVSHGMTIHKVVENTLENLPVLKSIQQELASLNPDLLRFAVHFSSATEAESHLCEFYKRELQQQFPQLVDFKWGDLDDLADGIVQAENEESETLVSELLNHVHRKFVRYHDLLVTPAQRLSEEERELKKRLKSGKAILIKAMNKKRNLPTYQELFNSDAAIWLRLFKPVWLTNAAELARTFPLEQGYFDCVLIDEASQMPVFNALGALQRSRRVLISGDSQQMRPSSFFKSGTTEIESLLDHAAYYFPNVHLKHHYRSQHSALIAFSNRFFYQSSLQPVIYGDYALKPVNQIIQRHYIPEGRFVQRRNEKEARSLVDWLKSNDFGNETVGIVAFSVEQAELLKSLLGESWLEKIESMGGFVKPLEKVQGDECDHLIVSFGYGKDEEDKFSLRFGPVNQQGGANRLNVLFTRASRTIHFFCSVNYADFRLSSNEGVQLLRNWFAWLELIETQSEEIQPTKSWVWEQRREHLSSALEYVTHYRVVKRLVN